MGVDSTLHQLRPIISDIEQSGHTVGHSVILSVCLGMDLPPLSSLMYAGIATYEDDPDMDQSQQMTECLNEQQLSGYSPPPPNVSLIGPEVQQVAPLNQSVETSNSSSQQPYAEFVTLQPLVFCGPPLPLRHSDHPSFPEEQHGEIAEPNVELCGPGEVLTPKRPVRQTRKAAARGRGQAAVPPSFADYKPRLAGRRKQCQDSNSSGGKKIRRRVPTHGQRRAANVRERKRMFHLNGAFDYLRTHIPTFAYEKHLSRIETLRLALGYIRFMEDIIRMHDVDPLPIQERYGNAEHEMRTKWSARV